MNVYAMATARDVTDFFCYTLNFFSFCTLSCRSYAADKFSDCNYILAHCLFFCILFIQNELNVIHFVKYFINIISCLIITWHRHT